MPVQWFDGTGQPWRNPSPNMRGPTAALLYPGTGMLEFCQLSVGRGTDTPFEVLGAPYFDELALAAELNASGLPGIRFVPVRFTPSASVFANEECRGVRFIVTDRATFRSVDLGITLACILQRAHGDKLELAKAGKLLGDAKALEEIGKGRTPEQIKAGWLPGLEAFGKRRAPFLLYPRSF